MAAAITELNNDVDNIVIFNDFGVKPIGPSSGRLSIIVKEYPRWKYETSFFLDKVWYYFGALIKKAKNLQFIKNGREYCILLADHVLGQSFSVCVSYESRPDARHFMVYLSLCNSVVSALHEIEVVGRGNDLRTVFTEMERLAMQLLLTEVFDLIDEAAKMVDFPINTRWSIVERGASEADARVSRFHCSTNYTDDDGTIHGRSEILHEVIPTLQACASALQTEAETATPTLLHFRRLLDPCRGGGPELLFSTKHWFAWPQNERVGLLVVMVEKIENFVWGNTPGSNYLTPNWSLPHRPQFLEFWRLQAAMVQRDFLRHVGRQYSVRGPHVVFCLSMRHQSPSGDPTLIQSLEVGDALVLQTYCEMPGHWHPNDKEHVLVIEDEAHLTQTTLLLLQLYAFLSLMKRILMATSEGWGEEYAERKRSQVGFARLTQWLRYTKNAETFDAAGEIVRFNLVALMKLFGVHQHDYTGAGDSLATGEFYYHCPDLAGRDHHAPVHSLSSGAGDSFERPFFK